MSSLEYQHPHQVLRASTTPTIPLSLSPLGPSQLKFHLFQEAFPPFPKQKALLPPLSALPVGLHLPCDSDQSEEG